jgi:leader peptidase (prepilin peptidase) / N-methyltransferase
VIAALWAASGALAGAIAGSFIATLIVRWPAQRRLNGRSACDTCSAQLRWFELVPIVSFAAQFGMCRHCAAPITPVHPIVEILCAAVGALSLGFVPGITGLCGAMLGWLLVALGMLDLLHFWLPDRLTAALALSGLAAMVAGVPPPLSDRLIGGAAGFLSLAAIAFAYQRIRGRDGMGAGDPKLFGAIGLWTGWQVLPLVLLGASAAGLGAAFILALRSRVSADTRLPLGTMLAAAAFPVWLYSAIAGL